ncbi:hypothetical protein [Streptomyces sp. FH025]|uniref:hypothetical protein n=1 Tax=Streptomyces sp. FH025 TaxID=2815937 RepID=UPI001A9D41AB|nr:hypothetical protein [Streptomyces sp. FH025]MBO1417471.1 hypothetical protein [Streptomyces sp. FH025]
MIFAAQPASALDPISGTAFSVDKKTAAPGDRLTLTLSLTNTETNAISFAYVHIQPTWPTNQRQDVVTPIGCGGESTDCTFGGFNSNAAFHLRTPIAPGDTRTVTVTVQITSTPTWTGPYVLNLAPYVYAEYGSDAPGYSKDRLWAEGLPELQTVIS